MKKPLGDKLISAAKSLARTRPGYKSWFDFLRENDRMALEDLCSAWLRGDLGAGVSAVHLARVVVSEPSIKLADVSERTVSNWFISQRNAAKSSINSQESTRGSGKKVKGKGNRSGGRTARRGEDTGR
jgi:hypothetical protein